MYILATIHSAEAVSLEMVVFVDHSGSPGIAGAFSKQPQWYLGLGTAAELINLCIADVLFVCIVKSYFRQLIYILPDLAVLGCMGKAMDSSSYPNRYSCRRKW